jgi:ankyrin repeat protein
MSHRFILLPYDIDHSDTDLPTPLFSACKYGNKDVVDFLLKRITGSMYSIMNVTIIVKQNLYNICMTLSTSII